MQSFQKQISLLKKKQCIKLDNKIRLPKLQSYQKLLITNQCNFDAISVTMINFGVFSNIKMTNNSRKASLSGRVPWNARIPFVYPCNVEKTHNIDNLCIYPSWFSPNIYAIQHFPKCLGYVRDAEFGFRIGLVNHSFNKNVFGFSNMNNLNRVEF